MKLKIYLDNCCLNRPFDENTSDRINMEAEAILSIVWRCQQKEWKLIGSNILELEMNKMSNEYKRQKVTNLYTVAENKVVVDDEVKSRAIEIQKGGIKIIDSFHIALAEKAKSDVLLTTDDLLEKKANKMNLKIKVYNPVNWLMEVTKNEQ